MFLIKHDDIVMHGPLRGGERYAVMVTGPVTSKALKAVRRALDITIETLEEFEAEAAVAPPVEEGAADHADAPADGGDDA